MVCCITSQSTNSKNESATIPINGTRTIRESAIQLEFTVNIHDFRAAAYNGISRLPICDGFSNCANGDLTLLVHRILPPGRPSTQENIKIVTSHSPTTTHVPSHPLKSSLSRPACTLGCSITLDPFVPLVILQRLHCLRVTLCVRGQVPFQCHSPKHNRLLSFHCVFAVFS